MIQLWLQSKVNNQQSKIQDYISLHVTEINDLHYMHIARHFMHHFTSFYVTFYIISCHISYISLHISHTSHTCHACHAIRISQTARISCIAPYIKSFSVSFHVISSWKFIAYSSMTFRIEERRKRVKTPHYSIGRRLNEAFYSRG